MERRKLQRHHADAMTPRERKKAILEGKDYDRFPAIPFLSELKCFLSGISIRDFWHDPQKMVEAEIVAFERFGYDRIVIGPNTRGITEALGGEFVYPEQGIPYIETPLLKDLERLDTLEAAETKNSKRLQVFREAARRMQEAAGEIVPVEASVGGPFTIASNLRGVERLLRDCRKNPDEVQKLLRIITDTQKNYIDTAAECGIGIAMADPVANPALIGPKMYEKYVFPYTKELTDYALEKTGEKVSLHMCGATYTIWKYIGQYALNEISLDNIVDLDRAAEELGKNVPIAGNVDPVEIVMNGTKEEIFGAVKRCIDAGKRAEKGYHLATGCDIPEQTKPEKVDWFMEAARAYKK